jgi:hypothetical protein
MVSDAHPAPPTLQVIGANEPPMVVLHLPFFNFTATGPIKINILLTKS